MTEPPLKILARFDINDKPGFKFDGRAYLSSFHFGQAYSSDLVYAVNRLRDVLNSSVGCKLKYLPIKHTVALMWEEQKGRKVYEMIDFFGWTFDRWDKDADLYAWKTRNGILVEPICGALQATSENGITILNLEKEYRRTSSREHFMKYGPDVKGKNIVLVNDFASPSGRLDLNKILEQESHIINP